MNGAAYEDVSGGERVVNFEVQVWVSEGHVGHGSCSHGITEIARGSGAFAINTKVAFDAVLRGVLIENRLG